MLGVFDPKTYTGESNNITANCSDFFGDARMIIVYNIDSPTHVKHLDDDNDFIQDMRGENVWVYCYEETIYGTKCGSFNNIGVFHWIFAQCDLA